ncbi:hypothetical protein NXS19_003234 [Fusarium pseudograminearum]|nr:hypothetical protein NXS19_003234 [Fusarium pseudograminearum]
MQDDLISLLGKLPPTLVSIELSFLSIIEGTGHYAGILANIRDKLGWRHRPIDKRIRGGGYAEVDFGNGMQYDEFDPDFARPYR